MGQDRTNTSQSHYLYEQERQWRRIYPVIAGVDEAGRGPLAGPVVAAAVVIPETPEIPGIDDSKKLSAKKREELFDVIIQNCLAFGIGIRSARAVDRMGIARATYSAMKLAVDMLALKGCTPDLVLVDGYDIPGLAVPQKAVIKGDSTIASIACASIVAKVVRDRIMREYDSLYPGYGFAEHKGYGTASHLAALASEGPCSIHRKSFGPVSDALR